MPPFSALVRPQLEHHVHLGAPTVQMGSDKLKSIYRRATGMETSLSGTVKVLSMLNLQKRSLRGDVGSPPPDIRRVTTQKRPLLSQRAEPGPQPKAQGRGFWLDVWTAQAVAHGDLCSAGKQGFHHGSCPLMWLFYHPHPHPWKPPALFITIL